MRHSLIALLMVLGSLDGAHAQTVAEVASKWGLLGTWQINCSAPVSQSNAAITYLVTGGKLQMQRDFGGDKNAGNDTNTIVAASRKPDGALEYTTVFPSLGQTRQQTDIKGSDGRRRAVSNRNVDTNEYTIKDGKLAHNGTTSLWQTRCR
jgi:hypothetical protein